MDFITLDFETATSERDSPCEIGLTFVKDRKIVETKSWLIRPRKLQFGYYNILIHGIKPDDVANEPEFDELWKEIKPLIEDQFLIAHNAAFDISVLRKTLETYHLPCPPLSYACSFQFLKKAWQGLSGYNLKALCDYHQIDLNHHRAGDDARATAELVLKAFETTGSSTITEFQEKLSISVRSMSSHDPFYDETNVSGRTKKSSKYLIDPSKHRPSHIFYNKTVIFTGTLSNMPRMKAQQKVLDIGGRISNMVDQHTHFLVVGKKETEFTIKNSKSNKMRIALALVEQGANIQFITEEVFLKLIK
jgi:DNA polymerase-3 subunit epsilon